MTASFLSQSCPHEREKPLPSKLSVFPLLLIFLLVLPISALQSSRPQATKLASTSSIVLVSNPSDNESIRQFAIPTSNSGPNAIAAGSNHTFWFTEYSAAKIGEFIATNDSFKEFALPTAGAQPDSIAIDRQGRIWFSDFSGSGKIWEFDPSTRQFTSFVPPTPNAKPLSIIIDRNDDVWFTEFSGNKLAELVYPDYRLREYPLPVSNADPAGLALDRSSTLIWITEAGAGALASFNLNTDAFTQYDPPAFLQFTDPVGVAVDQSGSVWSGEHGGSSVVKFVPSNSSWTSYPTSTPTSSFTYQISAVATVAVDGRGNVWFVEHFLNRVGRLTPSNGTMQEFQIPGSEGQPSAYSVLNAVDSSGNFWFTNFYSNEIGMIPANVSSPVSVSLSHQVSAANAGQTIRVQARVTNVGTAPVSIQMQASSSFSSTGQTNSGEVSFNVSSFTLPTGKSVGISASVTPDKDLAAGSYSVSIIAGYSNGSAAIATLIFRVSNNLYFLYYVGANLPIIILVLVAAFAASYLFIRRRRRKRSPEGD